MRNQREAPHDDDQWYEGQEQDGKIMCNSVFFVGSILITIRNMPDKIHSSIVLSKMMNHSDI